MTSTARLTGVIMSSPDPDRAAQFYREVLGIPYVLSQHGDLPAHYECDVEGIHFAILKGTVNGTQSMTPSFQIEQLDAFLSALEARGIRPLHRPIELGGGPRISTIADPDGNDVRLYSAS
jgi:predicted enzyme related to lactoylglutathione lyase